MRIVGMVLGFAILVLLALIVVDVVTGAYDEP